MTNIDDIIADLKTDDPMTGVLEVIETLENAQKRIEELETKVEETIMTEPTYTEAEIATAMMGLGIKKVPTSLVGEVLERLKRPKHSFAEGQIVADGRGCGVYKSFYSTMSNIESYHHLNMTELGPHVKTLRDAMFKIVVKFTTMYPDQVEEIALKALTEFDKAVGENDE